MPITNLHDLTDIEFDAHLFALIAQLEGNEPEPYLDTAKQRHPTIGIGFNLDDENVRNNVFVAMGLTEAERLAIKGVIDDLSIRALPGKAADVEFKRRLQVELGRDFVMTPEQIVAVFSDEAQSREETVIATAGFTQRSEELIALISLQFNGLYGNGLKGALALADPYAARAQAWYQIRYAHADQLHRRRYVEADLFGLYGNGGNFDADDAKAIYRMFGADYAAMRRYEEKYSHLIDGANRDLVAAGFTTRVNTLADNLQRARDTLLPQLLAEYSGLDPASLQQIAADAIYLDAGRGLKDPVGAFDPNRSSVLDARVRRPHPDGNLVDDPVNNLLIGEAGGDYLIGGRGDDLLLGGEGLDTYLFEAGDGDDTLFDADGGSIVRAATTGGDYRGLARGSEIMTRDLVWETADHSVRYTRIDRDLRIDFLLDGSGDSLLIRNFDFDAATGVLADQTAGAESFGIALAAPAKVCLAPTADQRTNLARKPDAAAGSALATLVEKASREFTVFVSDPKAWARTLVLRLAASLQAQDIVACTGAEILAFANGELHLTLAAGEDRLSFALIASGDVDDNLSGAFSVTVEDPNAPPGAEPLTDSLTLSIEAGQEADLTPTALVQNIEDRGEWMRGVGVVRDILGPTHSGTEVNQHVVSSFNNYAGRQRLANASQGNAISASLSYVTNANQGCQNNAKTGIPRRGALLAMTLSAAICGVAAQPALGGPPDRYRYQLEVGQDLDVCRHLTDVFSKRFQTPWDKGWLRPEPMPTFQGVRYDKIFERLPGVAFDKRFTFDLLLSKYPSSTEFDAVLWKESRMDFGQGAIGPVLIAKLDIDNDGRMDWVVKYGVMSIPPRDEGRNAGGSESLAIFSEVAFDPLAPLHLSQLAEGQRGMNPPRLMYRHETWQFRPFIYQNRVYVSAYEASWAPEPLDAKTSIRIFPDEEFMTVQSVATDVTRDGQLLRAVADEICRVRMLMQDQGRAN